MRYVMNQICGVQRFNDFKILWTNTDVSCRFIVSPLAHGVVDFIALTAADSDGVKILEGAQAHTWDGHQRRAEAHYNGLCVVEGHAQVVTHGNHERIVPATQSPVS